MERNMIKKKLKESLIQLQKVKDGEFKMTAGKRRYGKPRSEKERIARHKRLHPKTKLPKRGSGLGI